MLLMLRFYALSLFAVLVPVLGSGQDCTANNKSYTAATYINIETTQHSSGMHQWGAIPCGTCTYSSASAHS